jgi:type I restriction enzyme S subunit
VSIATQVRLGEVLRLSDDWVRINPVEQYQLITVRLHGGGVVARAQVAGAQIAGERRRLVRHDQFLVARIDARNGAMGVVPPSLHGGVVSNDFLPFEVDRSRLLPDYLGWLSRSEGFVASCRQASEGTTNRVRLSERRLLDVRVPLPALDEQQDLIRRINELDGLVTPLARFLADSAASQSKLIAALELAI